MNAHVLASPPFGSPSSIPLARVQSLAFMGHSRDELKEDLEMTAYHLFSYKAGIKFLNFLKANCYRRRLTKARVRKTFIGVRKTYDIRAKNPQAEASGSEEAPARRPGISRVTPAPHTRTHDMLKLPDVDVKTQGHKMPPTIAMCACQKATQKREQSSQKHEIRQVFS